LTAAVLFRKLRKHKLEMNRLNEQENGEKRMKEITLKSAVQRDDSYDGCSSNCSDIETLTLLTRKF